MGTDSWAQFVALAAERISTKCMEILGAIIVRKDFQMLVKSWKLVTDPSHNKKRTIEQMYS